MGALIVGAVGISAAFAYDHLEDALVETAAVRMQFVLDLLAPPTAAGVVARERLLDDLASHDAVVGFAAGGAGPGSVEPALVAVLEGAPRITTLGIWSTDGACLAEVRRAPPSLGAEPTLAAGCSDLYPPPGEALFAAPGYGGLLDSEWGLYSEYLVPIGEAEAATAFLHERRVLADDGGIELVANLISQDARLYAASADGAIWTDFVAIVPKPLETVPLGELATYERADGREAIGMGVRPGDVPWILWLERDREAVVAPASLFLRRSGVLMLAVLAIALVLAWVTSRSITGPLKRVTDGAEALAAGRYEHRLELERGDELGRLSEAFNAMARQIAGARDRLESRVSERTRELEEALQRLQDAQEQLVRQEKLAFMGHLAGSVGHELRTPLSVIVNTTYVLRRVLDDPPEKVEQHLGILESQVDLCSRIINDLLDFGRMKPPERQVVELAPLVAEQLIEVPEESGIVVSVDVADVPPVFADPLQVQLVLRNLVSNAVEAMRDGGTLRIQASMPDEETVAVAVSDTGPGIPIEERERVFDPLYTTKTRGIGLGLSLSRSFATSNGGGLALDSEEGRGTTLLLTLPTARPAVAAAGAVVRGTVVRGTEVSRA